MATYDQLLESAREHYNVPAMPLVDDVASFLTSLGATPLDLDRYGEDLIDEFVDPELAIVAFTLRAPQLLRQRARSEELENFASDPSSEFDPLEYGEANEEWTVYSHEIESCHASTSCWSALTTRLNASATFESMEARSGCAKCSGPRQAWLPRDPGSPTSGSTFFGRAFQFADRAPFTAAPLE